MNNRIALAVTVTASTALILALVDAPWPLWAAWAVLVAIQILAHTRKARA